MPGEYFFYWLDGQLQRLDLDKVYFFEANNNYVKIWGEDTKLEIRASLKGIMNQLPPGKFAQVERSFVISLAFLETVGKGFVSFRDIPDFKLPLARRYEKSLKEKIRILNGK